MQETKTCSTCGDELPATTKYFHRKGHRLAASCKQCRCKLVAQRRNPESDKARLKQYYRENRSRLLEQKRANYSVNREIHITRVRNWQTANPEKVLAKEHRRAKRRRQDPDFRLRVNFGRQMSFCLHGGKQSRSWLTFVSYTMEDLRQHLEGLFREGMNWNNYGSSSGATKWWTVDHIRPVSTFDFSSPNDEQFKECWALANLQPLWSSENFAKCNKWK